MQRLSSRCLLSDRVYLVFFTSFGAAQYLRRTNIRLNGLALKSSDTHFGTLLALYALFLHSLRTR